MNTSTKLAALHARIREEAECFDALRREREHVARAEERAEAQRTLQYSALSAWAALCHRLDGHPAAYAVRALVVGIARTCDVSPLREAPNVPDCTLLVETCHGLVRVAVGGRAMSLCLLDDLEALAASTLGPVPEDALRAARGPDLMPSKAPGLVARLHAVLERAERLGAFAPTDVLGEAFALVRDGNADLPPHLANAGTDIPRVLPPDAATGDDCASGDGAGGTWPTTGPVVGGAA